jgi:plasmid stabilization system protein ParE
MPKRYRVEITRQAEADIEAIYSYIRRDSVRAASAFVAELDRQIVSLERFPLRCPVISEAAELGNPYRHLVYGEYRTIVRVVEGTVYILRIVHGARLLDLNIL